MVLSSGPGASSFPFSPRLTSAALAGLFPEPRQETQALSVCSGRAGLRAGEAEIATRCLSKWESGSPQGRKKGQRSEPSQHTGPILALNPQRQSAHSRHLLDEECKSESWSLPQAELGAQPTPHSASSSIPA